MSLLDIFQSFAQLYLESGPTDKAETRKEPLTNNCGMCQIWSVSGYITSQCWLCCIMNCDFVATESVTLVKVKLNDESGLEANGKAVLTESDSESGNKLYEHKQEPTEEKSTVPQVFKKVYKLNIYKLDVFFILHRRLSKWSQSF